jgi:hypothetical protein
MRQRQLVDRAMNGLGILKFFQRVGLIFGRGIADG